MSIDVLWQVLRLLKVLDLGISQSSSEQNYLSMPGNSLRNDEKGDSQYKACILYMAFHDNTCSFRCLIDSYKQAFCAISSLDVYSIAISWNIKLHWHAVFSIYWNGIFEPSPLKNGIVKCSFVHGKATGFVQDWTVFIRLGKYVFNFL